MEKQKYNSLLAKANLILSSIESDNIPIDELSKKLEEAYALIEELKSQLFAAELQIEQIINSRNTLINAEEDNNGAHKSS